MNTRIEALVIGEIVSGNAAYAERVLPHLDPSYFQTREEAHIIKTIKQHFTEFKTCPSKESLAVSIKGHDGGEAIAWLEKEIVSARSANPDWLIEETRKFIEGQRRLAFGSRLDSATWPSSEDYSKVMNFSFDDRASVGYDFFQDAESLYDYLTNPEFKLPFDIDILNRWTDGGVPRGSINIILAPTSGGKSLVMCHLAACYMRQGRTVAFVTLEMSQRLTANRIWANLMDRGTKELRALPKAEYLAEMQALRARLTGELVIQHYPAYSAGANTFRSFLRELKQKRGLVPDVLFVDYLGLCRSSKSGKNASSYEKGTDVANELRGLASEQNVALWTGVQGNRDSYHSPSLGIEHTSESYGINSAAFNLFAVRPDKDLPDDLLNVSLLKQQNDGFIGPKEVGLGLDKPKMKIFEIDEAAVRAKKAFETRRPPTAAASERTTATGKSKQTDAEKVKARFAGSIGFDEELA